MTSPEERISAHDLSRDSGNNDRLHHITPGTLDFSRIQAAPSTDLDQQIFELKKSQELQKQMLLHTFQEKSKQLELQHKLQLEHKFHYTVHTHGGYQELQEQRIAASAAAAEQEQQQHRERRERETAVIKRKENSANASPEVKQILNHFQKKTWEINYESLQDRTTYKNN